MANRPSSHAREAAEKAWEAARFSITVLDDPKVAGAFDGWLVNALRACFIRGFEEAFADEPRRIHGMGAPDDAPRSESTTPSVDTTREG